jgi:hypothetical protein
VISGLGRRARTTFGFRKALQPSYALAALSELVYGWFTEGFDTLDLRQAKALLGEFCACQRVSKRPLRSSAISSA